MLINRNAAAAITQVVTIKRRLRAILRCAVPALLALAATAPVGANELQNWQGTYREEPGSGALSFVAKEGGQRIEVPDIFTQQGQNTRSLLRFNGQPALEYQSTTVGVPYRAVVTLYLEASVMKVDCLYLTTRSGRNGAFLHRAVCGLGRVLDEHFPDLASEYTVRWYAEVDPVQLRPAAKLQLSWVTEARWEGAEVRREYLGRPELETELPRLTINSAKARYGLVGRNVYMVYAADNLQQPARLEVADKNEQLEFQPYEPGYLSRLLGNEKLEVAMGPFAMGVLEASRLSVLQTGDERYPVALMVDHSEGTGGQMRSLVASYSNEGGPPTVETLFYHRIKGEPHVVVLVSWQVNHAGIGTAGTYYEIHAYQHDGNGTLEENQAVRLAPGSSGLDGRGGFEPSSFPYQNAALIKGYLDTFK
ncbi:hypothetical protein [Pseudomonas xanthosomatis]|uniref:hypothetical protein n=1 Tax=Pseudomonas xanthosomatis TaxID=2842356 RepID=UPI0035143E95